METGEHFVAKGSSSLVHVYKDVGWKFAEKMCLDCTARSTKTPIFYHRLWDFNIMEEEASELRPIGLAKK